ncbi:hypothetical protein ATCC90586_003379 [Pythium insidiosum]|nr:hypothetical protein ATCC90586_003379 [Pythium insidiosum]
MESENHPRNLDELTLPIIVRRPAFQLSGELGALVRERPRGVPAVLRTAFAKNKSVAVDDPAGAYRIDNARIPTSWVIDYQLEYPKARSAFVALVHFGPGFTPDHFETCAAATYGVLLHGEKHWKFRGLRGETMECTQHAGDTVYVPAGWVHNVKTESNGAIIVGETRITKGSAQAFITRVREMYSTLRDSAVPPLEEAAKLCSHLGISISKKAQDKGGSGLNAPVLRALRSYIAQQRGGSKGYDKHGNRRKRRVLTSKPKNAKRRRVN